MNHARLLLLLLWCLASFSGIRAQNWTWARASSNSGMDGWPVAVDRSGNVFTSGIKWGPNPAIFGAYTVPFAGAANYQCIIVKYDGNGNFLWAGQTDHGDCNLIGIATDLSGNCYLFGSFDSGYMKIGTYTFINGYRKGDYKYFLVKYDPNGNIIWATADGNAQANLATVGNISVVLGLGGVTTDGSGNVYIICNFHLPVVNVGSVTLTNSDPTGSTEDILIAKYDQSGNLQWAKSAGGTKSDDAYGICTTPAGDVYLAGDFGSPSVTFGPSTINNAASPAQVAFIARYDGSGNASWADASGGQGNEYAAGLASDASGNVYLVGGTKDATISFAGVTITDAKPTKAMLYLVKFDPSNNVTWYKTITSPNNGQAWGYSVTTSPCGYVWVSGVMSDSVYDSAGHRVPGEINVDGHLVSALASSYDPVFAACYTSAGAYFDAITLQSGGDDQNAIACDSKGNLFMASDYVCSQAVNIGNDILPIDPHADELIYVAKYTPLLPDPGPVRRFDTVLCYTKSLSLSATPGFKDYLWYDSSKSAGHGVKDTGIYWVRCSSDCNVYMIDTFVINSTCDCSKYLFVPNSFTPNGDGQNDLFYPRSSHGETRITTFRIYNRWGELLFSRDNIMANDVSNAWDGSYQGSLPLPDVYVFVVEAVCEDGNTVSKKGSVTVIR